MREEDPGAQHETLMFMTYFRSNTAIGYDSVIKGYILQIRVSNTVLGASHEHQLEASASSHVT